MDISTVKLYIFDLNGTLSNTPFIDHKPLHALPGRRARLDALRAEGKHIAIATNQSGPLWREATGQDKYPSVDDLAYDLYDVLSAPNLGIARLQESDPVIIALYDTRAAAIFARSMGDVSVAIRIDAVKDRLHYAIGNRFNHWIFIDPEYRKPQPEMLLFAINHFDVTEAETLFVGDMEDDRQAAMAAGVSFAWSRDFFGEGQP